MPNLITQLGPDKRDRGGPAQPLLTVQNLTKHFPVRGGLLNRRIATVHGGLRGRRLDAIPGSPPDLAALPPGCAFGPRCAFAVERCRRDDPPMRRREDAMVRCVHDRATLTPA